MKRAVVVLAVALGGCSHAAAETHALSAAVERFRRAPPAGRSDAVGALEGVVCTDDEVCAAKRACVAFARPTAAAGALKQEVEQALGRIDAGTLTPADPAAQALPGKLEEASKLLNEGHASLTDCEARLATLRVKYGP